MFSTFQIRKRDGAKKVHGYSPVFNKYGRSLRDFLTITLLTNFTMIAFVFVILWVFEDNDMTGIGSCGTADCIDQ